MSLIELQQIEKNYINGDVVTPVLHNMSLSVKKGEFMAIMGPSGSGKSTLMHILGFLDRPTAGHYIFDGEDTHFFNDEDLALIRNEKIGFVFQAFFLLPRISLLDNVALPLLYGRAPVDMQRARKALEAVGLGDRLDYLSNQISGGQKQRVAIARALVNNPQVIFADEPTGNLDSRSGENVMQILENLNKKEGRTIILVTHDPDVAARANRVLTIRDGQIISDTTNGK